MGKSRVNAMEGKMLRQSRVSGGFLDFRRVEGRNSLEFDDERGQVLPWAILLMMLFLGFCALTIDIGHGFLIKRELQASCDAAALAAAEALPSSSYSSIAQTYSAASSGKNTYGEFSVGTPTVTGLCLTTVKGPPFNVNCTATSPNAVQVTETATIQNFFAGVFGMPTMTITAQSTASKGSKPQPFNVAIVLDTTPSMNDQDNNCGATQLQCATKAFQFLLEGLDPAVDNISLFTFPNITTTTVKNDYDCQSSNPTVGPYTFPSSTGTKFSTMGYTTGGTTVQETYQVTGFLNDYRTSNSSTSLNSNSDLANAVGGNNCQGIQTSTENTYYAAAIYAAQAALTAEQAANPGTQNALIFLSDGNATAKEEYPTSSFREGGKNYSAGAFYPGVNDMVVGSESSTVATSGGSYPSWVGECGQGVDAANYATSKGTQVFTIAYGSPTTSSSSNCGSDRNGGSHKNITPCQAMQQMSSGWNATPQDTSHFFSDYYVTGGDSGCQAADANNTITSLQNIVDAIVSDFSGARLIPNGTP